MAKISAAKRLLLNGAKEAAGKIQIPFQIIYITIIHLITKK